MLAIELINQPNLTYRPHRVTLLYGVYRVSSFVILVPCLKSNRTGALGFSVLRIWPIFGSVFRFLALKNCWFSVLVSCRFAGFLEFSLWFLSSMVAVF